MSPASRQRARWQASLTAVGTLVLAWWLRTPLVIGAAAVAATFAMMAWLSPTAYAPVQRGFDWATRTLTAVISWVVLGLVYFALFTPLRALRAATGGHWLALRRDPSISTYLEPLPPAPAGRFERQF